MNKKLKSRIFQVPKSLAPLKAIVMRELDAADQREAARYANMKPALDNDEALAIRGQEMLRISLVAIQVAGQDKPEAVAQPFAGMDNWPTTWLRFTEEAFTHMNTLDPAEVGEALAKSQEWTGDMALSTNGPGGAVLEA